MRQIVTSPPRLEGLVVPAGDKSISHRAILLNSIAEGAAHVSNLCVGDDRASLLRCLRGLGARIRRRSPCPVDGAEECFEVLGLGLGGLREPKTVLNAGNSGTAMRLLSGLLAAHPFFSVITGDRSLRSRPMKRIVEPLRMMGAAVMGRSGDSLPPLAIRGGELRGIEHRLAVPSAQLKSCILIAGLHAEGETIVRQPAPSRDHTERILRAMRAHIDVRGLAVTVRRAALRPLDISVPGDISSAAFWLVAGCSHPNARIRVAGVGINQSRTGVLDVLESMGARISIENVREQAGEPSADLVAESSDMEGTDIRRDIIPRVIDELPVLALAAAAAKGKTVIADAGELRVKETDRIRATALGLASLGARVEETPDGMTVHGGRRLRGAECRSFGDHRIAMTMGVAGLLARGETAVVGAESASVSYPDFWDTLSRLRGASA